MPKVFISYRRADSLKDAGRIYDRMVQAFGKDNIFKDMDSIPLGSDFRGVLAEAVSACEVQLAIIGKRWLDIQDEHGQRRLENPGDFVRIEVQTALFRDGCLLIPVLVDNASMPQAKDLPDDLLELAFKNATVVRDDPDFHGDVDKLIRSLEQRYGIGASSNILPVQQLPTYNVHEAISRFYAAFEVKDWDTARALLTEIRASGKAPGLFNVDANEKEIWSAIEAEQRDKDYGLLRVMVGRARPQMIWDSLQVFWRTYPDYDPDNLARFKPVESAAPATVGAVREPPLQTATEAVLKVLPGPFEWIAIPAGKVTLVAGGYVPEGEQTFDVPTFAIAKYPVTNAQYEKFIKAGGYDQQQWWTPDGWQVRHQEKWKEPRYWNDKKWNGADYPVVGVSWYESVAFCLWLSEVTGDQIMLPGEQQWQRAAQGDDGRAYPWGKDWDGSRCNNSVGQDSKKNSTSPVKQYEGQGDSAFKVVDMAGNVWEWCRTVYEIGSDELNGTYVRVLRGGSWDFSDAVDFRVDFRNRGDPVDRLNDDGFRCARSSK